jgi:hemolysin D
MVQQGRLAEAEAQMAGTAEQYQQAVAEYHRTVADQLTQAEQKVRELSEDLVKATRRTELQTLTAPVDGVVQQVAVHTVGGVVTPAQQLMVLVPADSRLEIEAMVSNKDIGFVQAGEPAEIKVDTFNFTKYGLLHGKVLNVSEDAIVRDKANASGPGTSAGADTSPSAAGAGGGQDLTYSARVSLDRAAMDVDGRTVALAPGMAVTVEIKTGERRVIEYLLSPLLRYKQEALRER